MLCSDGAAVVSQPERPLRLRIAGELDAVTSAPMRRALREAFDGGARDVVLDVGAVTFMDAAALGMLLGAHRLFTGAGGALRLTNPQRGVRRVLEVTALDHLLLDAKVSPMGRADAAVSSTMQGA
jgi:anti-anti-sigma factor